MDSDRYEVKMIERYVPKPVGAAARAQVDVYIAENLTAHTELKIEHVKITYTTFLCGVELGTHQNHINEHFDSLHKFDLNDIIDMPKVNKIHVDHNNAFKHLKATDIHKVYKGNRQRIIQGW